MSAMPRSNVLTLRPAEINASNKAIATNPVQLDYAVSLRAFPLVSTPATRSLAMRDEILERYAFIFCQGGFHQLGLTFEQFLLIADAVGPSDLRTSWKLESDC